MKEIEELSDAVIMAWYPGQEGGEALADLLFGDANFSGRLPITFPESTDVLPAFDDYTMKGRTYKYMTDGVMYPFGYGLSYSKVTYSDATATLTKQGLHVTATLRNESDIATNEVPQVYLRAPGAGQTAAEWTLIAFDRIDMPAKATKEVSFDIPTERLMTVQDNGESKILKGQYPVAVAAAAPLKRSEQLGVSMTKATFKK
jgi:beta-glucosidase